MEGTQASSLATVLAPSNKSWNHKIQEFKLPPLTRIMLADVDAGSDTPSLVGKVLKWPNDLWNAIDKKNMELASTLLRLSELYDTNSETYTKAVERLAVVPAAEWSTNASDEVTKTFVQAHEITQAIRALMRTMSTATSVPIEPAEQTRLLDACLGQKGVLGGGVPGAGGYDAIYLLVLDTPSVVQGVDNLWAGYEELGVSPLNAVESKRKGVRVEVLDAVKGLGEAIEA
ncbi:phosphomevalonate kinase [Paramarasmius palmivorus]|uniref:Phosphomevalonate kinase n=1 Tax=Paramarasmius palmivorus TaxID=297713 RepID=A0AAW0EGQ2_9AGAR